MYVSTRRNMVPGCSAGVQMSATRGGQNLIAGLANNPLRLATASFLRNQTRQCRCTVSRETDYWG